MTPELIGLVDKITFTSALLIAVYILYRDSRSDDRRTLAANTESIAKLIEHMTTLAALVQVLIDAQATQVKKTAALENVNRDQGLGEPKK